MIEYLIWISVIALVYLDAMAVYYAQKSEMYEPLQLFLQTLFVICLPVIGALLVLNIALSHIRSAPEGGVSNKPKSRFLELLFLTAVVASHSNSLELSNGRVGDSNMGSGES